jgi:hypothetical protein
VGQLSAGRLAHAVPRLPRTLTLAGLTLVAVAIVIAHRVDAFTTPQFYAEDGAQWFSSAYALGPIHALGLIAGWVSAGHIAARSGDCSSIRDHQSAAGLQSVRPVDPGGAGRLLPEFTVRRAGAVDVGADSLERRVPAPAVQRAQCRHHECAVSSRHPGDARDYRPGAEAMVLESVRRDHSLALRIVRTIRVHSVAGHRALFSDPAPTVHARSRRAARCRVRRTALRESIRATPGCESRGEPSEPRTHHQRSSHPRRALR